jgi:hypothetical protein
MVKTLIAMDLVPAFPRSMQRSAACSSPLFLPRKMGLSHVQHLAAAAGGKEVDWVSDEYCYSL